MQLEQERSRPTANRAASNVVDGDRLSLAELDLLAGHVDGAFVVVVERSPGRYRRRPYLTAAAAENAARRATERGENVRVYLAELRPLYRLVGDAS